MGNADDPVADDSHRDHDCEAAGTLAFVAHYGAPGTGQAWTCTRCGKAWSRVDGVFWPADQGVHILSIDDVQ
ncbi:hypothetical protein ACIBXA_32345 [Micromonospora echinaurantiaca]|uniref:hypothetical protein n=1 Tax=Micromonospora echinaurantiaca TaxID=47857 RepID=UPI0037AB7B6B